MLIENSTKQAMGSISALFAALAEDPRMNVGQGIVAVGRPEPAVPKTQHAHVKIAYDRGHTPVEDSRTFVVHTAVLHPDEGITLQSGHYDLMIDEAWAMVSGRKVTA